MERCYLHLRWYFWVHLLWIFWTCRSSSCRLHKAASVLARHNEMSAWCHQHIWAHTASWLHPCSMSFCWSLPGARQTPSRPDVLGSLGCGPCPRAAVGLSGLASPDCSSLPPSKSGRSARAVFQKTLRSIVKKSRNLRTQFQTFSGKNMEECQKIWCFPPKMQQKLNESTIEAQLTKNNRNAA